MNTKYLKSNRDECFKILDQDNIKARSLADQPHHFALEQHKIIPKNDELVTDFDLTDRLLIYSTEVITGVHFKVA